MVRGKENESMMKKILVIANWKCNPVSLVEAKQLFNLIKRGLKNIKKVEVVICPPFIYIPTFQHSNILTIKIGAQDCFWEKRGPFTGEISPLMLKNLGCYYVIIGHSTRRKLGETDEIINKKVKAAIRAKLKPILCIGETFEERKKGKTFKVLQKQLKEGLKLILNLKSQILNPIVAYEPFWAIGTGNPCPPERAKFALLVIRKIISQLFNHPALSKKIKIIYGGSVNSEIAKDYIKEAKFQGLLIGGASLNAKEFIKIVKNLST